MSTEIKPGQVWAWKDTDGANGDPGHMFRIDSESDTPGHWRYGYVGVSVEVYGETPDFLASAEVINRAAALMEPAPPLPTQDGDDGREAAPLDAAKVKAGDTEYADDAVRQEVEFRQYLARVTGIDSATPAPLVQPTSTTVAEIRVGQPGDLREGDVVVKVPTWHTNADTGISGLIGDVVVRREAPAPEPLVEGRLYEVTAPDGRRCRAFYKPIDGIRANHPWVSEEETRYRSDSVTDVRPLVVIDPADEKFDQDSLAEVARTAWNSANDVVEWETVANAIRAHLGLDGAS